MAKKYKFVGEGMGVPGLAHEITDEEAKAENVKELLDQAVMLGLYVEVDESPSTAPRKPRGSAQGENKSEVSNG